MEINIISLENRKGTRLGETQTVRRGYARYLIRAKKALPYNKHDLSQFEAMRASLEAKDIQTLEAAKEKAQLLKDLSVQLSSRASDGRRLYGSLGAKEIADAITKSGVPIEKRAIHLKAGAIRHAGEHIITIHLHDQVACKLTIQVVPA